jgi:hypothetical protein
VDEAARTFQSYLATKSLTVWDFTIEGVRENAWKNARGERTGPVWVWCAYLLR